MEIDRDFLADFHDRPGGAARAHEVRLQGGRLHDGALPVTPPLTHGAGRPVEEVVASLGPALLVGFAALRATLRRHVARARSRAACMRPAS
jgi:hypothetical protein